MEAGSARFAKQIDDAQENLHTSRDIIITGDLLFERENALLAEVFKYFRGWRDKKLFENFPASIEWTWVAFDKEDMQKILYITYSYWDELSNYTGSPLEAAKTIRSGRTIYGVPNDRAKEGSRLQKQGYRFPPLIFLTDRTESRYIILEGHGRMTAYDLVPELFQNVSALLGV